MQLFKNKITMILFLAAFAMISIGCTPMDQLKSTKDKSSSSLTLNTAYEMGAAETSYTTRQAIAPAGLANTRYQLVGYQQSAPQVLEFSDPKLFTMSFAAIEPTQVDCGQGCVQTLPSGDITFKTACQSLDVAAAYVAVPSATSSHVIALDTTVVTDEKCSTGNADVELNHFITTAQAGSSHLSVSKLYLYIESPNGITWIFKRLQ